MGIDLTQGFGGWTTCCLTDVGAPYPELKGAILSDRPLH